MKSGAEEREDGLAGDVRFKVQCTTGKERRIKRWEHEEALDVMQARLDQVGALFVTRAKRGMDARRGYSAAAARATGVICDQVIALNGFFVCKNYPEHLRRIRFKDPKSGKTLVFLTDNTALPALTIAALDKNRWQAELFFKLIKRHLRLKKFLGMSKNSVKRQIRCALVHSRFRGPSSGANPKPLVFAATACILNMGAVSAFPSAYFMGRVVAGPHTCNYKST